jgi:hypothetical protein
MEDLIKFETGNVYALNFIGDADLKPLWICTAITKTTATFERFQSKQKEIIKKKIRIHDGSEYIKYDNYSMAPTIYANKIIQ